MEQTVWRQRVFLRLTGNGHLVGLCVCVYVVEIDQCAGPAVVRQYGDFVIDRTVAVNFVIST